MCETSETIAVVGEFEGGRELTEDRVLLRGLVPQPFRPERPNPAPRWRFVRGAERPRGVVWFGVSSFWGHLRHFASVAIATDNVDSRDWMTADEPLELKTRVAQVLGSNSVEDCLVDALDRDLWLDFVADTGDDVAVSRAVARLLFADYELPDPDAEGGFLRAPRGEILFFGGDTAYPVATAQEITNRVIVPFNQVLETLPAGPPRVLLGIPGNHDWYDGLDGFARMFRRTADDEEGVARPSVVGISQRMIERYAEWAKKFVRGGTIDKPKALALTGYRPVQSASYFALPLTSRLQLTAVDRQLSNLDSRQVRYFDAWRSESPDVSQLVMLPDPLFAFGAPSPTGTAMVEALSLDLETKPHFLLSGDVHHYERIQHAAALHVTAGGGGAFLHPAPLRREQRLRAEVEWPTMAPEPATLAASAVEGDARQLRLLTAPSARGAVFAGDEHRPASVPKGRLHRVCTDSDHGADDHHLFADRRRAKGRLGGLRIVVRRGSGDGDDPRFCFVRIRALGPECTRHAADLADRGADLRGGGILRRIRVRRILGLADFARTGGDAGLHRSGPPRIQALRASARAAGRLGCGLLVRGLDRSAGDRRQARIDRRWQLQARPLSLVDGQKLRPSALSLRRPSPEPRGTRVAWLARDRPS